MTRKASDYFQRALPPRLSHDYGRQSVMLLEGEDDCWFFGSILAELGAEPNEVTLVPVGGKNGFKAGLEQFFKSRPFKQQEIKR